jgi:uncharacterized membrane protein
MEDLIARWTSLPNLHPAVVHFPIAILPLAVLVDAAGLALRRRVRLDAAAVVLYGIGLGAAGAAYWAGRQAADSLVDLPPKAPALIGAHADWALYTLWTFAILAALRGGAAWVFRHRAGATPVAVRVALLVVALPGLGLLLGTADRGGALVYRHGIAVSAQVHAPPTSAPRVASAAGSSGLVDALAPAPGFSADAVAWRPAPRGEPGPILEVRGRTLLTLPGVFSDVRLDAQLEILDFEGTIGLAHNVADADTRGLFTLSTRGSAALIDVRQGRRETLHEAPVPLPAGELRLAVSAAGRHLQGFLNGHSVVHGHASPAPEGACGVWLDGRGSLRLRSLSVTPLSESSER